MNAYSFNTNSKSKKKIDKTMLSIHFKVRNCQGVLPINVTKLSAPKIVPVWVKSYPQRIWQKSNFRLPSTDCISFPGYCSAILRILLTKHATNNTLLLRCVWMSHKLQTFGVNEASFSGVRIHVTCRIRAKSHAFRSLTDALPRFVTNCDLW